MKLITVIVTLPLAVFLALAWHEATEKYEPGGDQGTGWRVAAGWIVLVVWLIAMATIAALGALDDRARRLEAAAARPGRHRVRYADTYVATVDTRDLPVVWVVDRTPTQVVLDEQPTGGER